MDPPPPFLQPHWNLPESLGSPLGTLPPKALWDALGTPLWIPLRTTEDPLGPHRPLGAHGRTEDPLGPPSPSPRPPKAPHRRLPILTAGAEAAVRSDATQQGGHAGPGGQFILWGLGGVILRPFGDNLGLGRGLQGGGSHLK